MLKSSIQKRIFSFTFALILFSCGTNKDKESQTSSHEVTDHYISDAEEAATYVDESIDNSTLEFLESLQPSEITAKDVEFAKGVSLADYSMFMNMKNSIPSFYEDGNISKRVIDSLKNSGISSDKYQSQIRSLETVATYIKTISANQQKWDALMVKLLDTAIYLTTKENFSYQDSTDIPKQTGLAYLWGGKKYKEKTSPTLYQKKGETQERQHCPYKIHGLDCSGFIYTLFTNAGINMRKGKAEDQRKVDYLKSILIPYFGDNNVEVQDMGRLTDAQVLNGDIAYRINDGIATHIGIILKDRDGKLHFAESYGRPTTCDDNLKQGPTMSKIEKINTTNYKIVRIIAQ